MALPAELLSQETAGVMSLDELPTNQLAQIVAVQPSAHDVTPDMLRRLAELGFLPGEPVRIVARVPGGTPLAVRVGTSTFALRRHEARCVHVSAMSQSA